jgi:hypothetical protein
VRVDAGGNHDNVGLEVISVTTNLPTILDVESASWMFTDLVFIARNG